MTKATQTRDLYGFLINLMKEHQMTDTHDTKVCSKCRQEKTLDCFGKKSNGLKSWCKPCENARTKKWYEKNKEQRNIKARKWAAENKDKVNAAKRARRARIKASLPKKEEKPKFDKNQWLKNNKEKLAGYRRKWLSQDPKNAIADRVRRRINNFMKQNGYKKTCKTHEILGCNWDKFKIHVEKQFQPGMSWENRSEWHIDHIIPLASAKTEEDVIRLNHFTNLRPLWAKDNLSKGAKIEHLI